MNRMPRITGIVFAITAIILMSLSSQAQDGITLTNEVGPRGKTPPGEMRSTEPVLSLVGDKDPWFRNPVLQGDCGDFMLNDASQSVVFKSGSLRYAHETLERPEVKRIVRTFLVKHLN